MAIGGIVTSYRPALYELFTDPMQLALDQEHAEQFVGQIGDVLQRQGFDIVAGRGILQAGLRALS
jgi:hypothetical protein